LTATGRTGWLAQAAALGRWLENAILIVLLTGLMLLASTQILLRNVFSIGLPWADGLVRLTVLWLALVGAVAASRDHKHIAINLSDRFLPERWRRRVEIGVDLFTAVVAGWLCWYALVFVGESREFGDALLGGLPAWPFQVILPVGFGLIAYRYAWRCVGAVRGDPR
jgi:TRAP-type C4-dicarboxylate transport system permease small subunit